MIGNIVPHSQEAFVVRPIGTNIIRKGVSLIKKHLYISLTLRGQSFMSIVNEKRTNHPIWNEEYTVHDPDDSIATIRVYKQRSIKGNKLLGEASFNFTVFRADPDVKTLSLPLSNGSDIIGDITLQIYPTISTINTDEFSIIEQKLIDKDPEIVTKVEAHNASLQRISSNIHPTEDKIIARANMTQKELDHEDGLKYNESWMQEDKLWKDKHDRAYPGVRSHPQAHISGVMNN